MTRGRQRGVGQMHEIRGDTAWVKNDGLSVMRVTLEYVVINSYLNVAIAR